MTNNTWMKYEFKFYMYGYRCKHLVYCRLYLAEKLLYVSAYKAFIIRVYIQTVVKFEK